MKGQTLFVRPVTEEDWDSIDDFYREEGVDVQPSWREGDEIIGKLVGRIVSHASFRLDRSTLFLTTLYVAAELRRKRVGRATLGELESLAQKLGCATVIVPTPGEAVAFFLRTGFAFEGDTLKKTIGA